MVTFALQACLHCPKVAWSCPAHCPCSLSSGPLRQDRHGYPPQVCVCVCVCVRARTRSQACQHQNVPANVEALLGNSVPRMGTCTSYASFQQRPDEAGRNSLKAGRQQLQLAVGASSQQHPDEAGGRGHWCIVTRKDTLNSAHGLTIGASRWHGFVFQL
eukprot:scaffold10631_cov20-Tisochrysis_lutea.AAC.1